MPMNVAVNDRIRSKGIGTKIFDWLKAEHPGKEITLNVEPLEEDAPNAAQREKRIQFYHRQGFRSSGYQLMDTSGVFDIMTTGEELAVADYKKQSLIWEWVSISRSFGTKHEHRRTKV